MRAENGAPDRQLHTELLELLWPWIIKTTDSLVRTLPPGADANAVRSEVVWECFQAVRRIRWSSYRTWPALLKARVRGGYTSAARAQDVLTRGQRRARLAYLDQSETRIRQLGRTLTAPERHQLALSVSPYGQVSPVLLGRSMLVSLEEAAGADGEFTRACGLGETPESVLERRWTAAAVRSWIRDDLPAGLAVEVAGVLREEQQMTARLRLRLRPFIPALRDRIGVPWREGAR